LDQDLKEDISLKDEDKYADDADMAGQKVDLKTRTTVRNLRFFFFFSFSLFNHPKKQTPKYESK